MKKLLNMLRSKWFITVLAVLLVLLFTAAVFKGTAFEKDGAPINNYRNYDTFRWGMPDYGIINRKNFLPVT